MDRRDFLTGLGMAGILGPSLANATTGSGVHAALPAGGVELGYNLSFGGSEIGRQVVRIRSHDLQDHVVIDHEVNAEVRLLFAVVFSLKHESTEIWDGLTLRSVRSNTLQNGENSDVLAERVSDGFRIKNPTEERILAGSIVTIDSFWFAAAIDDPNILNTRTGEIAECQRRSLGQDRWHITAPFAHGTIETKVEFRDGYLLEAEIDSDGHTLMIQRS